MKNLTAIVLLVCSFAPCTAQDRSKYSLIKKKMLELRSFVGTWRANTVFYNKEGKAPQENKEIGTYLISWTLDSCYLKWDIQLERTGVNKRTRYMLIMLTFNPDSKKYEQNYFYNGSALKVFETADFDASKKVLTTHAFIPNEDGVRDETVRTTTVFLSADEMVYEHFSRYSDDPSERKDFAATLKRVK